MNKFMKKNERCLLVGASVPEGIVAARDFLKLKLGDMILTTLPDDKQKAMEVMDFCRENHVHVLLSELIKRGSFERLHCPSFSKEDFDEIVAKTGEYYLGRYAIGEAGGILYWPKAYTIGRKAKEFANLPKCDSAEDARRAYVKYLIKFIGHEREKVGRGRLFNVESSMLFNYHAEAGVDAFCLEMLPGDPFRIMPAIRGNARAFDREWGVHIAMGWYGGALFDDIWLKRWRLSLYYSFISGAGLVFPESGHYDYTSKKDGKVYGFNHPRMKASRVVLREFWRFTKVHTRPEGGPVTPVAVVFGNNEGCPGLWNPYAWGQYDNGKKWEAGPAEKGWDLLDSFHRSENCFNETLMGDHGRSFSGNPPLGQFDIVPAECDLKRLQRYKCLVFIGWNNMTDEIYEKLVKYTRFGGHLVMWLPHFNIEKKRGAAIRLFRQGDLRELFGVEICGAEKPDVVGVKYVRESAERSYNFPCGGTSKDPSFIGRMTPAKVKIPGRTASVLCGFSEFFMESAAELSKRPALIDNRLGKGRAWLVTAFEHPGDDGMKKFAENILRVVLAGEQDGLRLLCSDSVKYSVYHGNVDGKTFRLIYMLNTEFDVSQPVRVWLSGKVSNEMIIPPNEMRIACVIGPVVVCPESKDFEVHSIAEKNGTLDFGLYSLAKQFVEVCNLSPKPLTVRIKGACLKLKSGGFGKIGHPRKINRERQTFYTEDFLAEPEIKTKNTRLPY